MLGEVPTLPMLMHADNQAAINQIEVEASSLKAKHIDVRLKFVCDYARRDIFLAQYVRSEKMLADLLTKALDPENLASSRSLVCLEY